MIMTRHGGGGLLVVPFSIVAEAQKILLVATMTARGNVALKTTQLAGPWSTTRGTACHWPVTTRDGRSIDREDGCEVGAGLPPDDRWGLPRVATLAEAKLGEARRALMRCSRPSRRA